MVSGLIGPKRTPIPRRCGSRPSTWLATTAGSSMAPPSDRAIRIAISSPTGAGCGVRTKAPLRDRLVTWASWTGALRAQLQPISVATRSDTRRSAPFGTSGFSRLPR